jgi:hypothetical protein
LALVRYLGDQPSLEMDASERTYFPVMGRLVQYPASWAAPLAVAAGLCYLGTIFFGLRRNLLTWRGMGLSCLTFLICLVVSVILIELLWQGILFLHLEYGYSSMGRSRLNGDHNYAIGFVFLALAILTVSITMVRRKVSALDLAAGTYLIWFPASIAATALVPATSYLATWVLLFGSLALLLAMFVQPWKKAWVALGLGFLVSDILSVTLWIPVLYLSIVTGSLGSGSLLLAVFLVSAGLWLSSLTLLLDWITSLKRWILPVAALLAGLGFTLAGHFIVSHESPPAWVNPIGYWMNADNEQAYWVAFDEKIDARQSQIIVNPILRPYTELFPEASLFSVLTSDAPRLELVGPRLELLVDQWVIDHRILTARITTSKYARLYIVLPKGSALLAVTVPINKRIELPVVEDGWLLRFDGMPPEGVGVSFEFSQPGVIEFLLVEEMTGLPSFPGLSLQPEPGTMRGPGEFYQGVPNDFSAIYRRIGIPAIGGE